MLLILGMTAAGNVSALMHQKNLNELTDEADYIVVGTVKDMKSDWNDDKTSIYTDVTIGIEEVIKGGKSGKEIVVKIQGGEVDGLGQWVSDKPEFVSNEKVLLFLNREGKGKEKHLIIKSCFQGKYTIEEDRAINKGLNVSIRAKGFIDAIQNRNRDRTYNLESLERNAAAGATATCSSYYTTPKWPSPSATYRKNQNLPSDWPTAINKGAQAWNGASKFSFVDGGGTTTSCFINDKINTICRGAIDGPWGTIARTIIWYSGPNIVDVDTTFDSAEPWYAGTGPCPANQYDLWSAAAHEFGHWLILKDVVEYYCSEETMYGGLFYTGETKKRSIYTGDRIGIIAIYGQ